MKNRKLQLIEIRSMLKMSTTALTILGLTTFMFASTSILTPEPTQAFDFKKTQKKIGNRFKKTQKKIKKSLRKNSTKKKIIQGVGVGLLLNGVAKNSPAAAIIGVALVTAPEVLKRDIAKEHRDDINWSGCTRCSNKKPQVVTAPGRKISTAKKKEAVARVKEDIKDVQLALQKLGLYKKKIDGDFGPGTRAGVKEFQRSIGGKETGTLNAEQRHRLFIQAEQSGYTRKAVLNSNQTSQIQNAVVTTTKPVVITNPAIAEYALAKSQFDKFSENHLQSGNQTMVTSATMLPDGKIELSITDPTGNQLKKLVGTVKNIQVKPHNLSDQWIRIIYDDGSQSNPIILNTRDDFSSTLQANEWMGQAQQKINILSKLTGVEVIEPDTRVAKIESKPTENKPLTSNSDGKIILTESPAIKEDPAKTVLTSFEDNPTTQPSASCRKDMYVSFKFPNGENPISHYNITPPEGTMMIDNGDSTAYFTGSCIHGNYDFSYVYIQEGATKNDWKHFKREGSFEVASSGEQCSIDLNSPDGSAKLQCF